MVASSKEMDWGGISPTFNTIKLGATKAGAMNGVEVLATAAEINSIADKSARFVAAGGTKTLTSANDEQVIKLDTATGSVVTLPAASGSGARFRFLVTVLATSNSHKVQVASGSDTMIGVVYGARIDSGNAVLGFAAQTTSDTITLNRTTTGSVTLGEWLVVEDVATNIFAVQGFLTATGAAFATPFSAAVP